MFFFFKAITSALEVNFYFSFWSNLIQSRPFVCSASEKKLCFFVFKVSTDHLFDNLESEKRNIIVLGKSQENVLEFGSKNLYESWKVDCLQSAFLFKFR